MKISYRTHPILKKLEKNSLGIIGIDPDDFEEFSELKEGLVGLWKGFAPYFKSNISVLTNPFYEAIELSKKKLLTTELIESTPTTHGTILFGKKTICYSIFNQGEDMQVTYFIFHGDRFACYGASKTQSEHSLKKAFWASKAFLPDKTIWDREWAYIQGEIFSYINFLKYCEIETKIVEANSKIKGVNCKYVNDSASDIKILDSTWFTTLVNSEAFNVRGHFRLQPCGKGMKDRKLVWIKDFEKRGYTRAFKRPINIDEEGGR